MVLGHAHRRRSGQQPDGLAMGRGLGRGRRALLPHLQSGAAGGKVRPRRRLCPPLGSGACAGSPRRKSMPPGGLRARRWRAPTSSSARPTRSRSSTTPSPAPGRSPHLRRCAAQTANLAERCYRKTRNESPTSTSPRLARCYSPGMRAFRSPKLRLGEPGRRARTDCSACYVWAELSHRLRFILGVARRCHSRSTLFGSEIVGDSREFRSTTRPPGSL